ncbi:MAG TPA: hypothetical protein VKY24_22635 [Reyranella sp.]|nr:hypothetical protein [Reyranella sp.]
MSFLTRLFGTESSGLSTAQAIELKRLRAVTASLGEAESQTTAGLDGIGQLHLLNRRLGKRLASCSASERVLIQSKFVEADRILPKNVRTATSVAVTPAMQSVLATGCADLGRTLAEDQVRSIHSHLQTKHLLLCHVPHISTRAVSSLKDVPADESYATYEFLDLWSSPHILEFAAQDRLLDLAQAYLGCTPTLYSINAFWSFPNRQPHPYSQLFHRDWEDFRSLVVFTLLTPVDTPEEGAHYYVESSHTEDKLEESLRGKGIAAADLQVLSTRDNNAIAPVAMRLFGDGARRFDGPAGHSFCSDGYGLHRAVVPYSRPRLLLWFRYGNFYNETMYTTPLRGATRAEAKLALQRIPSTPRHRYVFRYIMDALSSV